MMIELKNQCHESRIENTYYKIEEAEYRIYNEEHRKHDTEYSI